MRKKSASPLNNTELLEVLRLNRQGLSHQKLAERLGQNPGSIFRIIQRAIKLDERLKEAAVQNG